MVKLELNLKQIIGLYNNGDSTLEELKKHLNEFSKEEYIEYILKEAETEEIPIEEGTEEETDEVNI